MEMLLNSSSQRHSRLCSSEDSTSSDSVMASSRVSAQEMDEKRQQNIAYEYLCHLEEAKK